ncbi:MAG: hypothetical protein DRN95_05515 [Candidatus Hydrothermarchaeota archaeon]|nr:MAG: hypothetical protein DRN95_05515 [Candidatus Hydrothermarchaeota archaeon]
MKEQYRRPVYIDEIKEECLQEGVLESYLREIETGEHQQRKGEWYEYVLPTLIVVIWVVSCTIVFWKKWFILIPWAVCAVLTLFIIWMTLYLIAK